AVNDNQDVKRDEVLVRLDPRDYEVAVAMARAAVVSAKGDLQNAVVNVPLADDSTRSLVQQADAALGATEHGSEMARQDLEQRVAEIQSRRAAVATAEALVRSARADYDRAKLDRDRIASLVKNGLVAQQDMDHAEAAYQTSAASLEAAHQRLDQARSDVYQSEASQRSQRAAVAQSMRRVDESRASLANARSQRQQVQVRQAQVDTAQGRLSQAIANLQQAELNLSYCTIRAPLAGRVTRKAVELGQVVTAGQALLAVVDLDDVWVVANYKETELTEVRAGQTATVSVDTYPGRKFRARVDSIQAGSGAVFSLLPPENATGNFVKVVQRVPVKLVFEKGENAQHLLVPGMSVVPIIATR
ncbi:MAG TPA: HlyD family secretion protein, partial [Streptomyces sp.]